MQCLNNDITYLLLTISLNRLIIAIKHDFVILSGSNLADANKWKIMFDPSSNATIKIHVQTKWREQTAPL